MKAGRFFVGIAAVVCGVCQPAMAANTVCRAGNAALYAQSIKQAIGAQMTSAGIAYSAVFVAILADDRAASAMPFTYDANPQVTVSANPLDAVFNGDLPAPSTCAIPATLYIKVLNGNVLVIDKAQPVTIQGVQAVAPKSSSKSKKSKSKKRR